MRLKVIFAGTPQNAASTLRALFKSGVDIVGVLTRNDAPVGRKRILEPSPVAVEAEALGLKVIKSNSIDEKTLDQIKDLNADLGLIVAYGTFLNQEALDCLEKGWINLHYSLLPKYRGAAPVQHAILSGERETGVSIFQLELGMDTGPIFISVPTLIEPGENSGRLLKRLTDLGITALLEVLPGIAAGIARSTPQSATSQSSAPKLARDNAKIDWKLTAREIENLINAMNPEPMAWSTIEGVALRILSGREIQLDGAAVKTGHVKLKDGFVLVGCRDSLFVLEQVQPSGKLPMNATDWMRGLQSKDSIVLGT